MIIATVESISIENMVTDLFAVMDTLEIESCVLAAESAGGTVTITAALQQPQRCEGLILVDALLHKEENEHDAEFICGRKTNFAGTLDQFVKACAPETEPNRREVRNGGQKILTRASPESSIRLFLQVTRNILPHKSQTVVSMFWKEPAMCQR